MARPHRKNTDRYLRRVLPRSLVSWGVYMLVVLGTACLLGYTKVRLLDRQMPTFPLNQLERGFVSRKRALQHVNDIIVQLRAHHRSATSLDQFKPRTNQSGISTRMSTDLGIIQSLGVPALNAQLDRLLGTDLAGEKSGQEDRSLVGNNSYSRQFVTHRLCYATANTPQGNRRQVDPSFCTRLNDLLNGVHHYDQPALLTVFTWLPDSLCDVDKLTRRALFENWTLLRPLVQPVLFTDSRTYMALANAFDWPCFPVPKYSTQGVPVFKYMASTVRGTFNSTFYGYVRATTAFDASLVESLLKVKETYIDKFTGNWTRLKDNSQDYTPNSASTKTVLIYGKSLRASNLGSVKVLEHLSQTINITEGHAWPEKKDALTYLFYSSLDVTDIPDLIVEDKYLTSQLVSRSMALGHLVVDASATLFSIHVVRGVSTSEWGREYLHTKPRDPFYNRRLGSLYFHSQRTTKPGKRLNEVATKFSRSGNIFIHIRSGETISS